MLPHDPCGCRTSFAPVQGLLFYCKSPLFFCGCKTSSNINLQRFRRVYADCERRTALHFGPVSLVAYSHPAAVLWRENSFSSFAGLCKAMLCWAFVTANPLIMSRWAIDWLRLQVKPNRRVTYLACWEWWCCVSCHLRIIDWTLCAAWSYKMKRK